MVDSVEFGKFIVSRAAGLGGGAAPIKLNETKLHKLIYICDGFMLAGGVNLIKETAKAWNYGPVYPKVHKWLKKDEVALSSPCQCDKSAAQEISAASAESLVDRVLGSFGGWTASQLTAWSHRPGSPWERALERSRGVMNSPISKSDMRDYFKGLIGGIS